MIDLLGARHGLSAGRRLHALLGLRAISGSARSSTCRTGWSRSISRAWFSSEARESAPPAEPERGTRGCSIRKGAPILSVRDLIDEVATPEGARVVVDDLSFDLAAGETLCIAGESGSGKSMTALSIMRLLPEPMARIAAGSITPRRPRPHHAPRIARCGACAAATSAMIFQEPMTSLNPVLSIGRQLTEAIRAHREVGARRGARDWRCRRSRGPHRRAGAPARAISARAFRRHAPARDDRDGARRPARRC